MAHSKIFSIGLPVFLAFSIFLSPQVVRSEPQIIDAQAIYEEYSDDAAEVFWSRVVQSDAYQGFFTRSTLSFRDMASRESHEFRNRVLYPVIVGTGSLVSTVLGLAGGLLGFTYVGPAPGGAAFLGITGGGMLATMTLAMRVADNSDGRVDMSLHRMSENGHLESELVLANIRRGDVKEIHVRLVREGMIHTIRRIRSAAQFEGSDGARRQLIELQSSLRDLFTPNKKTSWPGGEAMRHLRGLEDVLKSIHAPELVADLEDVIREADETTFRARLDNLIDLYRSYNEDPSSHSIEVLQSAIF